MVIYAYILFGLLSLSLASEIIHKTRDVSMVMLTFAILFPLIGRVAGWF